MMLSPEGSIAFYGLKVDGKSSYLQSVSGDGPGMVELLRVTTIALGEAAAPGAHVVKISTGDAQHIVVCTLDRERCPQFACALYLESDATIENRGGSAIYLSGYRRLLRFLKPQIRAFAPQVSLPRARSGRREGTAGGITRNVNKHAERDRTEKVFFRLGGG